ncbi:MAG: uroporphyrinogen decarboxylase/cobalamine-independent methonine synthase family protein [Aggregatilineales bacterium]
MATAPFMPRGAVTGIGSLPITDPHQAVQFVAEHCPVIPFWPQLPNRDLAENMIPQFIGRFEEWLQPRIGSYGYEIRNGCLDAFLDALENAPGALDNHHAAGFFAFEQAAKGGVFSSAMALKGQVTGPITLGFQLFQAERPVVYDPRVMDTLARYVERLARWQVERFKPFVTTVIIFIDEPCLSLLQNESQQSSTTYPLECLSRTILAVKHSDAVVGIHCCASIPSGMMLQAGVDILSFDAHQYLEVFMKAPDTRRFLREKMTAYGLIPTMDNLSQLSASQIFSRWLLAIPDLDNAHDLAQRSLITATCGLGLLDRATTKRSFELAQAVADLMEKLAGES